MLTLHVGLVMDGSGKREGILTMDPFDAARFTLEALKVVCHFIKSSTNPDPIERVTCVADVLGLRRIPLLSFKMYDDYLCVICIKLSSI